MRKENVKDPEQSRILNHGDLLVSVQDVADRIHAVIQGIIEDPEVTQTVLFEEDVAAGSEAAIEGKKCFFGSN